MHAALNVALYASALLAAGLALHVGLGVVEKPAAPGTLRTMAIAGGMALVLTGVRFATLAQDIGGADAVVWAWRVHGNALLALAGGVAILVAASRAHVLTLPGAALIAASFGLTGHTQALDTPGLAPLAVAVHVTFAAFWFAAPLSLWPCASIADDAMIARLQRFSAIAILAVPALFALGVWLALRLGGGLEALVSSDYGRLLLAKLGAAGAALVLGAVNRSIGVTSLCTGRTTLKRLLAGEAVAFFAALALVAWATTAAGPPEN